MIPSSTAISAYRQAFSSPNEPFLYFYEVEKSGALEKTVYSRGQFWDLAARAARVLRDHGQETGKTYLHCFGANHPADLAFRLAAAMTGAVPATVNWQADGPDTVRYKLELCDAGFLVHDHDFSAEILASVTRADPELRCFDVADLEGCAPLAAEDWPARTLDREAPKIVIFTSGTTGRPKGVQHAYRAYETNRRTFDAWMALRPQDRVGALVVNPLHHANATAVTDWCMRRPGSELHLLKRYTTGYWQVLAEVAAAGFDRTVAPVVARHFDFLEEKRRTGALPVRGEDLANAMARVDFLIGSAPVGPTTVERITASGGKLPIVRFGSTETCLQVAGIPRNMPEREKDRCFRKGWSPPPGTPEGYYIGRPHPPFTELDVVASVQPGTRDFMLPRNEGEPGYLVTRGQNLMLGYVKQPEASAAVMQNGWYTGLGDIGYFLKNERDGERDYYWVSRESSLLIKGGANYAYDQIRAALLSHLHAETGLDTDSLDLAVVGVRAGSEHEDACCVTVSLADEAKDRQDRIAALLLEKDKPRIPKWARPDYLRFGEIPRNFKGAVQIPALKEAFQEWLNTKG